MTREEYMRKLADMQTDISAYKQEPSGDLISRQDAIKAIDEKAKRIKNEDTLNGLAGAVGILFDLPSVNPQEPKYCDRNICMANEYNGIGCDECEVTKSQEPSEDEYIKVPKKALKYRTAGMVAYNVEWLKNHFEIERVVICGEQEPCEDAISRDAVLEKAVYTETEEGWCGYTVDVDYIKSLPPVKPQKSGEWIQTNEFFINKDGQFIYKFICSECKSLSYFRKSNKKAIGANVCPNCGAKMD